MSTKNNIKQIKEIVNSVIEQIDREEENSYLEIRERQKNVDNNFEITHKEMIARAYEAVGEPIGKVEAFIVRNVKMDCGLLFCSINEVSEATKVGRTTVKKVFNALQYADIIRFYKYGVWAVHPKFLRRGSGGKFIGQMRFYNTLQKKEKPKKDEESKEEEEPTKLEAKLRVLR